MSAVFPLDQLARAKLPASVTTKRGFAESSLDALGALPPVDDAEAALLPVALGLTDTDIAQLQALSRAWSRAREVVVAAEQALAAAKRDAAQLPRHELRAGEVAARAYGLNGHGHALAQEVAKAIDVSRAAAQAVPVLERELGDATDAAARARGALAGATTECLRQALLRASKRYGELALEVTRTLAAMEAGIRALPTRLQPELVGWDLVVKARVCLPALPEPILVDRGGSVDMNFVPTLLLAGHPRLTAHESDAAGRLQGQLREALAPARIAPANLLG